MSEVLQDQPILSESKEAADKKVTEYDDGFLEKYGFSLNDTFRHALKFYKGADGKDFNIGYEDKLSLVAYTQQSLHGCFKEDKVAPLGTFDVIGKDRQKAWAKLGEMSKTEAMSMFVGEVVNLMPHFESHMQAVKHQEVELKRTSEEEHAKEADLERAREAERRSVAERQRQEQQRRQIQDALNKQTYSQFRRYAEQQYPNDPDRQAVLVRQLQEQHYRQYMQQVYQQQMETQASKAILATSEETNDVNGIAEHLGTVLNLDSAEDSNCHDEDNPEQCSDNDHVCSEEECEFCCDEEEELEVSPASMWTKKNLDTFKRSIREEGVDSVIKVGHGETVTVRVPTHSNGNALFWEFATDAYDIAFGLFFEWTESEETEISVHISESEDEDLEDEYGDNVDPETGSASTLLVDKSPPTSVVVPIYRRDCHEEVYAGSHSYPGKGVYLLKFDNTYSLWRSKTLYYRVYYTK